MSAGLGVGPGSKTGAAPETVQKLTKNSTRKMAQQKI
jgi:hypothetical protein